MKFVRSRRLFAAVAVALLAAAPAASRAAVQIDASISYEAAHAPRLDIDVWTNKEEGGVYRQGEGMRVFFRPSADAYVLIYNIDTEGYIHLVYPYDPDDPDRVEGGRTYQVPSRNDPYDLVADGPAGIEYLVAIASPFPFRDLPWYLTGGYEGRQTDDEYGDDDDNGDSGVIVGDPYIGMDRVVRRVVPRGREDEVATADTYFYIERHVDYPRYVCADCHSYGGWFDPYGDVCSVVDIRIDAGWAHFRPLRYRTLRPRYFYMVRSTAPTRYRAWKDRWSSVDGRATLRTRFQVDGTDKFRSRRQIIQRRTPPEFQNLRRPRTEGRVWRPDEVIRRGGGDNRGGAGDVRDRGNASDTRERDQIRQNQDARRREWVDRQRREDDQRRGRDQRSQDQRQMQDQRRDDQRQMQEQRRDEQRRMQEQRRNDQRREDQRDRARVEERRREDRPDREQDRPREEARPREDRRDNRDDSGDRGRGEDRRRDDGGRGRGQEDRGRGRGR